MAAADVGPLPQILDEITSRLTDKEGTDIVGMFSTTLDKRYRDAANVRDIFDRLCRDNRISVKDTFLLENCLGPIHKAAEIVKLLSEFRKKHKKEIEKLQEQESLFLRREELYNRVSKIMRNSHGLLLYGEAGVGKTFLAKDYLNAKQKDSFKEVDLREVKDPKVLIVNVAQKFGYIRSTEDADLNALTSCLRRANIRNKMTLFLDNIDDFIEMENLADKRGNTDIRFSDIVETIIKTGNGFIKLLLTARNPSQEDKINELLLSHRVGQLERDLALKLLNSSKMSTEPSSEMLNKAVEICKFIPLNISLVGGMLQNFGTAIDEVNHMIQTYAEEKYKEITDITLARKKEIEISTLSVLRVNFANLGDTVQQGAVALSLFCRPFQLNDVEFMFEGLMDRNRLNLILHALTHQKVLQFHAQRYDFHPMVRSYLKSEKDMPHILPFYLQAKTKFLQKFKNKFKRVAEMLQENYEHSRSIFQLDFANFELAFDLHVTDGIPLFENYYDLQLSSELLSSMFRKEWRINFFQRAAKSAFDSGENLLGTLFLCQAAKSSANTEPHRALQLLDEARPHLENYQKVVKSCPEESKSNIEVTFIESLFLEAKGNSFHQICNNSRSLSDLAEAFSSYQNCYALRHKIYGKDANELDIATSLSGLGVCECLHAVLLIEKGEAVSKKQLVQEKFEIAINCSESALEILKKISKNSPELSTVLQNIGVAYQESENYEDAYKYFKQALEFEQNLKIHASPSTASILHNIANTCRDLDLEEEALQYSKQAFEIRNQFLKVHPDTVQSLFQLAVFNHDQSMYDDAIQWYKRAFLMEEELSINNHSSVRMDIRTFMVYAYESAIEDGFSYFEEEMEEWSDCFSELERKENEGKESQKKASSDAADVSEMTQNVNEMALEEISLSVPSSSAVPEELVEDFADPGIVKMFMDAGGGRFEFKYLGVTLDVPQDAIEKTELQISCVALSHFSMLQRLMKLELGESVVSDVIKIGPEGHLFKHLSTLHVPFSVCEVQVGRYIAMKFFNEDRNTWETLPVVIAKDSETGSQMAIAKISKMTMYVVCVLHKVFDFPVPKSGTEIKVSEEGYDCKIKFEDGAFENGDARVKLKLSTFSASAIDSLEDLGLKTSPVLHVNMANAEILLKPVHITLPMINGVASRGKLMFLQGTDKTFEDITFETTYEVNDDCVTFKVAHFSNFVVIWAACLYQKLTTVTEHLKTYINTPFNVWFYVYGKRSQSTWKMCVSCAQEHQKECVRDVLCESDLKRIEQTCYGEGIYTGTRLKVALRGSFRTPEENIMLFFKPESPCYTKLFRVKLDDTKHDDNDIVILGPVDDKEYISIPIDLGDSDERADGEKVNLKSIPDDNDSPESDGELYEEQEPYRFFGLKLDKSGFQDVRLNLEDCIRLENLCLDPYGQIVEGIKSLVKQGRFVAATKHTLCKLKECLVAGTLKDTWYEDFFEHLKPLSLQERLGEVMRFLKKPCRQLLGGSNIQHSFLRIIWTRKCIFSGVSFRRTLFKKLHLKRADIENIEREAQNETECCRCLIEQSVLAEDMKIVCLFDILKALLRTQRYFHDNGKQRRNMQKLLDDLGDFVERSVFEASNSEGDDW